MKLVKAANKTTIKISRSEWQDMGRKAGWIKEAACISFQVGAAYRTLKGLAKVIALEEDGILFEYVDGVYIGKQFKCTAEEASEVHTTLSEMETDNKLMDIGQKHKNGPAKPPGKIVTMLDKLMDLF